MVYVVIIQYSAKYTLIHVLKIQQALLLKKEVITNYKQCQNIKN